MAYAISQLRKCLKMLTLLIFVFFFIIVIQKLISNNICEYFCPSLMTAFED